jgi:hypothetical protein
MRREEKRRGEERRGEENSATKENDICKPHV